MLYFYALFLILALSEGCRPYVRKNSPSTLPIPYPKYYVVSDPSNVTVRWDPVEVSQDNPILGFKIKLWEPQKIKIFEVADRNGTQELVEKFKEQKKSLHAVPDYAPTFEEVVPPDTFVAHFFVKTGVDYEVRGQTFNSEGDGPLSYAYGIRLGTPKE